jgi:hypothetical protein
MKERDEGCRQNARCKAAPTDRVVVGYAAVHSGAAPVCLELFPPFVSEDCLYEK